MSTNILQKCNNCCTHVLKNTDNAVLQSQQPLFLDTLAHLDQKSANSLSIRARTKWNSYNVMQKLVQYAEVKANKSLIKKDTYWKTYFCNATLFQGIDGKITTEYCKQRWCITCNRIRNGIMWNKYEPPMRNLSMKFVTLTTSFTNYCTTQSDLEFARKMYLTAIQSIWRKLKNKCGKIVALRKTEVTWEKRKTLDGEYTFHPHFHFLIEDKNNSADVLRDLWCEYFSEKKFKEFVANKKKNNKDYSGEKHAILNKKIKPYATYYAQHVRVADKQSFAETLKYLCKTHTEVFNEVSQEYETNLAYEPRIMDIIFFVFKNKKVIQAYNLPEVELEDFDVERATIFVTEKDKLRVWNWSHYDRTWIDFENGDCLTDGKFLSKNNFKYNLLNNSS